MNRCLRRLVVKRFLALRDTAFIDRRSYFNRYALLSTRKRPQPRWQSRDANQPRQSRGQYIADQTACDADPKKGAAIVLTVAPAAALGRVPRRIDAEMLDVAGADR